MLNEKNVDVNETTVENESIVSDVQPGEIIEGTVERNVEDDNVNDYNKRTYHKINSEFLVKFLKTEKNSAGEDVDLFKVLNPKTNVVEIRQLSDDEKHEIRVQDIIKSHTKFHPIKHAVKTVGIHTVTSSIGRKRQQKERSIQTNITVNQFGKTYRKERQRKNKMARASRKANR